LKIFSQLWTHQNDAIKWEAEKEGSNSLMDASIVSRASHAPSVFVGGAAGGRRGDGTGAGRRFFSVSCHAYSHTTLSHGDGLWRNSAAVSNPKSGASRASG
jgi:hypothetical protein